MAVQAGQPKGWPVTDEAGLLTLFELPPISISNSSGTLPALGFSSSEMAIMSNTVPFYFHQQQPCLRFFTGDLVQQSLSTLIKFIRQRRLIKDRARIRIWGKLA